MYLDILVGIIIFFAFTFGLSSGFFSEFLSIFGVLGDFWLAQRLTPGMLKMVTDRTGMDLGTIGYITVYAGIFVVFYMLLGFIIHAIDGLFQAQKKGIITRLLGGVVGFLKGALLCILLIFIYDIAAEKFDVLKKYGENSYSKRVFLEATPYIDEYVPEQLKNQMERIKNNEIVNKYLSKIL